MGLLRLSHVGLCVADIDRSLRFYCDRLGFRRLSELHLAGEPAATLLGLADVDLRAVYLERDGLRLELLQYLQPGNLPATVPRAMNQLGLSHLSFRVDDLTSLVVELRAAGSRVVESSYIDIPVVGAAAVFVLDPDGNRIELVQSPGDPNVVPGG